MILGIINLNILVELNSNEFSCFFFKNLFGLIEPEFELIHLNFSGYCSLYY